MRASHNNLEPKITVPWAASVALAGVAMYQRRRAKQEHYAATHDELTGFLNTRGLEELLAKNNPPRAMLYADGTNQKAVNDTLGHARGDEVIVATADVLKRSLRPDDIVARIGGDEFLVLLDPARRSEQDSLKPDELLNPVINRIRAETQGMLEQPANADLSPVGFNIAVGGSVWEQGMSIPDMRNTAEQRMYEVKAAQHEQPVTA